MSTEPKRRFWQLHLSTAVLISITTGGLMWANLQPSPEPHTDFHRSIQLYGWPMTVLRVSQPGELLVQLNELLAKQSKTPVTPLTPTYEWNILGIMNNVFIGVDLGVILVLVAGTIGRRWGRKQ